MPNWTTDQSKVINERGNNILVSAAAGSGKTAVLVERIIRKIVDDKVEVDKLLVVTFTNAAAREMKSRIRRALDEVIKKDNNNEFLISQNTLLTSADISTIDSFCLNLVKNNYNDIKIDPAFRICDPNEEKLLFDDAIKSVMDTRFANEDNDSYIRLMDLYTKTEDYSEIISIIRELYKRAVSYPWPKEWLDRVLLPYMYDDNTDITQIEYIRLMYEQYINDINIVINDLTNYIQDINDNLIYNDNNNNFIADNINKAIGFLQKLTDSNDITELYNNLDRLNALVDDKSLKMQQGKKAFFEAVIYEDDSLEGKLLFSKYKDIADSYYHIYVKLSDNRPNDILGELQLSGDIVSEIISLTKDVMDEFDDVKKQLNVVTFNDVEHFALNILIDKNTKTVTDTAIQLQEQYDEVMVDEYQDINELQELILKTLSNGANMFMVGDIKQSIYGFRMAKPDIFVDKYEAYNSDNKKGISINLKKNFRSRKEVLSTVNDIFVNVMTKKTSGFDYDDDAKLYYGAKDLYDDKEVSAEIIIADSDTDALYESKRHIEAGLVAQRINELIETHFQVTDKDSNNNIIHRDIRYSDIAIILRSANTNGSVYEEVLSNNNIPCVATKTKGYLDTVEVRLIMSLLTVIDNPCKDIELAAVLHSPMFNISNDTLAKVKIYNKDNPTDNMSFLYYEIQAYIDYAKSFDNINDEISGLINAIDMINSFRELVNDTPIHEILYTIYNKTSYLDYVSSLIGGDYRRANLNALIDMALNYEKTSFKGVFRFVRYIESIKEYDLDMGEALLSSEDDDVVKIITMHKSKGLEYPVVFVSDLCARLNCQDLNQSNIIHNSLGLGLQLRGNMQGHRYKRDTQYKKYLKDVINKDYMAEEARLLYVALTRAKEKLIMTGVLDKPIDKTDEYRQGLMDYNKMINATSRMEWIIRGIATSNSNIVDDILRVVNVHDDTIHDIIKYSDICDKKHELYSYIDNVPDSIKSMIKDRLSYEYSYISDDNIKTKYSVSDIKHFAMEEAFLEEVEAKPSFLTEEKVHFVPHFIASEDKKRVNIGSRYGTAMHRVMECIDYTSNTLDRDIYTQIQDMRDNNRISDEQYNLINIDKIKRFISSDTARRMHNAAISDRLYIEQPFVMKESANKVVSSAHDNMDSVIIQGIIDVFFIEDEQIVLLDYKTDKVNEDSELITRYKVQLQLYAKAISSSMHMPIKEMLLYSFCLDKVIAI